MAFCFFTSQPRIKLPAASSIAGRESAARIVA